MNLTPLITLALAEDFGSQGFPQGDATTHALIPPGTQARLDLVARTPLIVAGLEAAVATFKQVDASLTISLHSKDGTAARPGESLLTAQGNAAALLGAERVALNLLQRACGVATLTRAFVEAVQGTKAKILDTRKTMPGLRALDKHAVACGGGVNHRFGLYDAILIKDNHLALLGGVAPALARARASGLPVIVECDTLEQVAEALKAKPNRILLDNMPPATLREAVAMVNGALPLEASGGITLETARSHAETGVDFLSVGALTHSAPSADIGADIVFQ